MADADADAAGQRDGGGGGGAGVAYLGPEASYTHQAAQSFFPPSTPTPLHAHPSIPSIFAAVQSRAHARGVVPFENSSNGSVVQTLDLLADVGGALQSVRVCGEVYVGVKHCLVGHFPPSGRSAEPTATAMATATPACDLSRVTLLYSHPQAWGQCTRFLDTHLAGVERRDVASTSRAAQLVAQDATGTSAALSSGLAAELFGLDVLAHTVNDRVGNTTRFLVLRHGDADEVQEQGEDGKQFKSMVSFTIPHTAPGALANVLAAFSRHGINLTSINTRPSGEVNWQYVFFVELLGRKVPGGAVEKALEEAQGVCAGVRWLGSWESGL
ncbi:prephenate dehydratase [Coniothyrium glycines]